MTESEAYERLRQWVAEQGMDPEYAGGSQWKAVAHGKLWVISPQGRTSSIYIVTPDQVRYVNRLRESFDDVLASLDK